MFTTFFHRNRNKLKPVVEFARDALQSLVMLGLLGLLAFKTFNGLHWLLAKVGLPLTTGPLATIWLVIGVAGALFWPLRYRHNMKGLWLESARHFAFLALFGPWAFALGFPL